MDLTTSTRIVFNRKSRAMWIEASNGEVLHGPETVEPRKAMYRAAGAFFTKHGFMRTGDYMLAGSGSPLRQASIDPLPELTLELNLLEEAR